MQIENNVPETSTDIFSEQDLVQYTEASQRQRFLNYLIDNLLMQYGLSFVTGTVVGYLLGIVAPEFIQEVALDPEGPKIVLLGVIIAYFNYIVYYTFCEKVFRGHTLGKLVTGSSAIRNDGQELTFKDAAMRSLIRIVPFEPFSAFSYAWHDKWTKTMVIKTR